MEVLSDPVVCQHPSVEQHVCNLSYDIVLRKSIWHSGLPKDRSQGHLRAGSPLLPPCFWHRWLPFGPNYLSATPD